jgi:hypothetical protein
VNRYLVDAVPDPDLISILMPIQIQIHHTVSHLSITTRGRCSFLHYFQIGADYYVTGTGTTVCRFYFVFPGLKCLCGVSSVSVTDPVSVPSVQTDSCQVRLISLLARDIKLPDENKILSLL